MNKVEQLKQIIEDYSKNNDSLPIDEIISSLRDSYISRYTGSDEDFIKLKNAIEPLGFIKEVDRVIESMEEGYIVLKIGEGEDEVYARVSFWINSYEGNSFAFDDCEIEEVHQVEVKRFEWQTK